MSQMLEVKKAAKEAQEAAKLTAEHGLTLTARPALALVASREALRASDELAAGQGARVRQALSMVPRLTLAPSPALAPGALKLAVPQLVRDAGLAAERLVREQAPQAREAAAGPERFMAMRLRREIEGFSNRQKPPKSAGEEEKRRAEAIRQQAQAALKALEGPKPNLEEARARYSIAQDLASINTSIGKAPKKGKFSGSAEIYGLAFDAASKGDVERRTILLGAAQLHKSQDEESRTRALELARQIGKAPKIQDAAPQVNELTARLSAQNVGKAKDPAVKRVLEQARQTYELSARLYQRGFTTEADFALNIGNRYATMANLNKEQFAKASEAKRYLDTKASELERCRSEGKRLGELKGVKPDRAALTQFWKSEFAESTRHFAEIDIANMNTRLAGAANGLGRKAPEDTQRIMSAAAERYAKAARGFGQGTVSGEEYERARRAVESVIHHLDREAYYRKRDPAAADRNHEAAAAFAANGIAPSSQKAQLDAAEAGKKADGRMSLEKTRRSALSDLRDMERQLENEKKRVGNVADADGNAVFLADKHLKAVRDAIASVKRAKTQEEIGQTMKPLRGMGEAKAQAERAEQLRTLREMISQKDAMALACWGRGEKPGEAGYVEGYNRGFINLLKRYKLTGDAQLAGFEPVFDIQRVHGRLNNLTFQGVPLEQLLQRAERGELSHGDFKRAEEAFRAVKQEFQEFEKRWDYQRRTVTMALTYVGYVETAKAEKKVMFAADLERASKNFVRATRLAGEGRFAEADEEVIRGLQTRSSSIGAGGKKGELPELAQRAFVHVTDEQIAAWQRGDQRRMVQLDMLAGAMVAAHSIFDETKLKAFYTKLNKDLDLREEKRSLRGNRDEFDVIRLRLEKLKPEAEGEYRDVQQRLQKAKAGSREAKKLGERAEEIDETRRLRERATELRRTLVTEAGVGKHIPSHGEISNDLNGMVKETEERVARDKQAKKVYEATKGIILLATSFIHGGVGLGLWALDTANEIRKGEINMVNIALLAASLATHGMGSVVGTLRMGEAAGFMRPGMSKTLEWLGVAERQLPGAAEVAEKLAKANLVGGLVVGLFVAGESAMSLNKKSDFTDWVLFFTAAAPAMMTMVHSARTLRAVRDPAVALRNLNEAAIEEAYRRGGREIGFDTAVKEHLFAGTREDFQVAIQTRHNRELVRRGMSAENPLSYEEAVKQGFFGDKAGFARAIIMESDRVRLASLEMRAEAAAAAEIARRTGVAPAAREGAAPAPAGARVEAAPAGPRAVSPVEADGLVNRMRDTRERGGARDRTQILFEDALNHEIARRENVPLEEVESNRRHLDRYFSDPGKAPILREVARQVLENTPAPKVRSMEELQADAMRVRDWSGAKTRGVIPDGMPIDRYEALKKSSDERIAKMNATEKQDLFLRFREAADAGRTKARTQAEFLVQETAFPRAVNEGAIKPKPQLPGSLQEDQVHAARQMVVDGRTFRPGNGTWLNNDVVFDGMKQGLLEVARARGMKIENIEVILVAMDKAGLNNIHWMGEKVGDALNQQIFDRIIKLAAKEMKDRGYLTADAILGKERCDERALVLAGSNLSKKPGFLTDLRTALDYAKEVVRGEVEAGGYRDAKGDFHEFRVHDEVNGKPVEYSLKEWMEKNSRNPLDVSVGFTYDLSSIVKLKDSSLAGLHAEAEAKGAPHAKAVLDAMRLTPATSLNEHYGEIPKQEGVLKQDGTAIQVEIKIDPKFVPRIEEALARFVLERAKEPGGLREAYPRTTDREIAELMREAQTGRIRIADFARLVTRKGSGFADHAGMSELNTFTNHGGANKVLTYIAEAVAVEIGGRGTTIGDQTYFLPGTPEAGQKARAGLQDWLDTKFMGTGIRVEVKASAVRSGENTQDVAARFFSERYGLRNLDAGTLNAVEKAARVFNGGSDKALRRMLGEKPPAELENLAREINQRRDIRRFRDIAANYPEQAQRLIDYVRANPGVVDRAVVVPQGRAAEVTGEIRAGGVFGHPGAAAVAEAAPPVIRTAEAREVGGYGGRLIEEHLKNLGISPMDDITPYNARRIMGKEFGEAVQRAVAERPGEPVTIRGYYDSETGRILEFGLRNGVPPKNFRQFELEFDPQTRTIDVLRGGENPGIANLYGLRAMPEMELGPRAQAEFRRALGNNEARVESAVPAGPARERALNALGEIADREIARISKLPEEQRLVETRRFAAAMDYITERAVRDPGRADAFLDFVAKNTSMPVEYAELAKRGIDVKTMDVAIEEVKASKEDAAERQRIAAQLENKVPTLIDMIKAVPESWFRQAGVDRAAILAPLERAEGALSKAKTLKEKLEIVERTYDRVRKDRENAARALADVVLPHGLALVGGGEYLVEVSHTLKVRGEKSIKGYVVTRTLGDRVAVEPNLARYDPRNNDILIHASMHSKDQAGVRWTLREVVSHETMHNLDEMSGFMNAVRLDKPITETTAQVMEYVRSGKNGREMMDMVEKLEKSLKGGYYEAGQKAVRDAITHELTPDGKVGAFDPQWATRDPGEIRRRVEAIIDRLYREHTGFGFRDFYPGVSIGELNVPAKATEAPAAQKALDAAARAMDEVNRVKTQKPNDRAAIADAEGAYEKALTRLARANPEVPVGQLEEQVRRRLQEARPGLEAVPPAARAAPSPAEAAPAAAFGLVTKHNLTEPTALANFAREVLLGKNADIIADFNRLPSPVQEQVRNLAANTAFETSARASKRIFDNYVNRFGRNVIGEAAGEIERAMPKGREAGRARGFREAQPGRAAGAVFEHPGEGTGGRVADIAEQARMLAQARRGAKPAAPAAAAPKAKPKEGAEIAFESSVAVPGLARPADVARRAQEAPRAPSHLVEGAAFTLKIDDLMRLKPSDPPRRQELAQRAREIAEDLVSLRALGPAGARLAQLYTESITGKLDTPTGRTLRDEPAMLLGIRTSARRAVLNELGVKFAELSPELQQRMGIKNLYEHTQLFDLAVHGDLRGNAARIAGIENPASITIERTTAGSTGAYRVTVEGTVGGAARKTDVYIKQTSLDPDMLAKRLYRGTERDIIIPEMGNATYRLPNGTAMEYGIARDIRTMPEVDAAVPLSHIMADPAMGRFVREHLPEFYEKLGFLMELSRTRGRQDLNSGNVWVVKKKDGTLALGMIDMDMVLTYPKANLHQISFAGYLLGEQGMTQRVELAVERTEAGAGNWHRQHLEAGGVLRTAFMSGVERAHAFNKEPQNVAHFRQEVRAYDGKPVGWGRDPRKVSEHSKQAADGTLITKHTINGVDGLPVITTGAHAGRIKLDAKKALDAFESMLYKKPAETFWGPIFDGKVAREKTMIY